MNSVEILCHCPILSATEGTAQSFRMDHLSKWANDGGLSHLSKQQERERAIELGDTRVTSTDEVNDSVYIPIDSPSKFRRIDIK